MRPYNVFPAFFPGCTFGFEFMPDSKGWVLHLGFFRLLALPMEEAEDESE